MVKQFLIGAVAILALASPAFAQAVSDTSVTVPYGVPVGDVAVAVLTAIAAAATFGMRFLPTHVQWALKLARADQLMEKALAAARAKVTEEISPRTITFDVKHRLVADALRYAVAHYPKLVDQLGGPALVQEKLQARLQEWIEKAAR